MHVPKGLLFGAWAVVAILGAAYVVVALSKFEPSTPAASSAVIAPVEAQPTTNETFTIGSSPEAATAPLAAAPAALVPATAGVMLSRVEIIGAEMDTQAFILEQTGLVPGATKALVVQSRPLVNEVTAAVALPPTVATASYGGVVDTPMAEVDTQDYILAQGGDALRYDLVPSSD